MQDPAQGKKSQDVSVQDGAFSRGFGLPEHYLRYSFERGRTKFECGQIREREVELGAQEIIRCTGRDNDHVGARTFRPSNRREGLKLPGVSVGVARRENDMPGG